LGAASWCVPTEKPEQKSSKLSKSPKHAEPPDDLTPLEFGNGTKACLKHHCEDPRNETQVVEPGALRSDGFASRLAAA
jgi:hypothetical protein